jgi:hypothetical protein
MPTPTPLKTILLFRFGINPSFSTFMNTPISSQATKLWQILSAPSTAETYKQALLLTWSILRETGTLIWLGLCFVLVGLDWFWTGSINLGRNFRNWFDNLETTRTDQIASEAGKAFLSVTQNSVAFTVSQAREQLGLPEKQPVLNSEPLPAKTSLVESAPAPKAVVTSEPARKSTISSIDTELAKEQDKLP